MGRGLGGGADILPIPSSDFVGVHPSLMKIGKGILAKIITRIVFKIQVGRIKHTFPFIVREGVGGWVTNTSLSENSTDP